MALAGLQRPPQGLVHGQVDVTQRDDHLTDWVITTEPVVVEHLHVECALDQLG